MRRNFLPCFAMALFGVLLAVALLIGVVSSQRRSAAELEAAGRAHARSLEADGANVPTAAPFAAAASARQLRARDAAAPASRPADTSANFPWTAALSDASPSASARPARLGAGATTADVSVRQRSDSAPPISTDASLQARGYWKDTGHTGGVAPQTPSGAKASSVNQPVNAHDHPPPANRRTPSLHESHRQMRIQTH